MSGLKFRILCLASALTLPIAHSAWAVQRTFVSAGSGSDANPCSRTAPCRNFAAAIGATDPGGEVVVLDSGGYGAVAIGRGVSLISPPGVHAGITGFSGAAIAVAVPGGETVVLRGLTLNAQGATSGIDFTAGVTLHVENCVVNGFSRGLSVDRTATNDLPLVYVNDTIFRNGSLVSNSSAMFFNTTGSGSLIRVSIDGVRSESNYAGLWVANNTDAAVSRSVFSGNSYGLVSEASTAMFASLYADHCVLSHNTYGGYAGDGDFSGGNAGIVVTNSQVVNNTAEGFVASTHGACALSFTIVEGHSLALFSAGGVFYTGGSNSFVFNANDGSFTGTIAQK